ncbi:MAG: hypothetical protein K2N93_03270, partial [Alistipes sp.]|nr:hypothetical protein [Alistipes sp.]
MRRYSKLICALAFAAAGLSARGATPETLSALGRGRDLFGFGRWSDARHEFLAARESLAADDLAERQQIDFYLAACAVELGDTDAEAMLRNFEVRYPGSVYANDVRFSLGSYYCAAGDATRAREAFAATDYRRLTAQRRVQYDVRMGYVAFMEGDYAEAYAHFDRVPARSEYADHATYYRAYIDYAEGRTDRAKKAFEALERSDAYRAVVPYYLLQIEYREGNYRYVVDHGEELARRAVPERRAEIERVVAESWFRLDDYNRTIEHLEAFLDAGGTADRDTDY